MNFTVYDKRTGRIIRTGYCIDDNFEQQAGDYSISDGTYDDALYYWDHGFVLKPPKPVGEYEFDYVTKTWVLNLSMTIYINKSKRNSILTATDWTQVSDNALTEQDRLMWSAYRKALRDMTEDDFISGRFPDQPVRA
jgi:hypothetical protein